MFKEVRCLDWDDFYNTMTEYYGEKGCEFEMKMGIHGEDIKKFVIIERDRTNRRFLNTEEAFLEIKQILFPEESVRVLSIYKSKENMFRKEQLHLALEPL